MALADKVDDAFTYVEKAMKVGKAANRPLSSRLLETDMDIASLRKDPRLAALIEKYYGQGEKQAKEATEAKATKPGKEAKGPGH